MAGGVLKGSKPPGRAGGDTVAKFPTRNLAPDTLGRTDTVKALKEAFGSQVTERFLDVLHMPDMVNVTKTPDGIELYDSRSKRPVRTYDSIETETMKDLDWVKDWYFSVFRKGDTHIARIIDNKRTSLSGKPLRMEVELDKNAPPPLAVHVDPDAPVPPSIHRLVVEVESKMLL